MNLYKKQFIIPFLILFLFFIGWDCILGLDPDFGWHLRMGQLILIHGIPKMDPFSYTMPSYPFVDHEWLTNVLIALIYSKIGVIGLSVIFTSLAYCALLLQFPLSHKKWAAVPLLLCIGVLSTYMGIRPQVISWVCFSLLLLILTRKNIWRIWQFSLPLLFLLWANLHGSFPLGIGVFGIFLVVKSFQKRKLTPIHWLLFICCIGSTFVNPYTYRIWWEVWVSLSDGSLRWSIQEWLPAFFFVNYYVLLLLPLSVVFIFSTRKHFSLLQLILYVILLLFGLSSTRNMPFWLILAFPMTTQAVAYFITDISSIPFASQRFNKAYDFYFCVVIVVMVLQVIPELFAQKQDFTASYYPSHAVVYLQKHPSSGNMFSTYAWGGYLIWKLPQKKVFIDGRMPSWRRVTAPPTESKDAFAESNAILTGKMQFAPVAKKYHIDTVLLMHAPQTNKKTLTDILSNMLHLSQENFPYFMQQLKQMGMKEVYKDKVSVIYRKM